MEYGQLSEPTHPAPELARGQWLNRTQQLTLRDLRGQVVLLDIWDYTCINCARTLPYVQTWHTRYESHGLTVVGVHTPEFDFGREKTQVALAVQDMGIRYPVLMDNNYHTWDAYDNRFWPAKYLIDANGYLRYRHAGEGGYAELEQAIQTLLREVNADADLPPVMAPLRPEDYPEVLVHRATPDLRGGLRRGALGNREGYADNVPIVYRMPDDRRDGAFYVAGAWQADKQFIAYTGRSEGVIQIPYEAAEVHAVFSPHADVVERTIHPQTVTLEIWQDDLPLHTERRGGDITADGRVLVDRPRRYDLVHNPGFEKHELTLRVRSSGFALYGLSFVSRVRD